MNHWDLDGKWGVKMEPSCRGLEEGGSTPRSWASGSEHCVYGTFGAEVWRMVQAHLSATHPFTTGFLALQMEMQGQQSQD